MKIARLQVNNEIWMPESTSNLDIIVYKVNTKVQLESLAQPYEKGVMVIPSNYGGYINVCYLSTEGNCKELASWEQKQYELLNNRKEDLKITGNCIMDTVGKYTGQVFVQPYSQKMFDTDTVLTKQNQMLIKKFYYETKQR